MISEAQRKDPVDSSLRKGEYIIFIIIVIFILFIYLSGTTCAVIG